MSQCAEQILHWGALGCFGTVWLCGLDKGCLLRRAEVEPMQPVHTGRNHTKTASSAPTLWPDSIVSTSRFNSGLILAVISAGE